MTVSLVLTMDISHVEHTKVFVLMLIWLVPVPVKCMG